MDNKLQHCLALLTCKNSTENTPSIFQENAHHLEALKSHVDAHRIIPFIGAGFSADVYPTWTTLLHSLNEKVHNQSIANKVDRMIKRCDFQGAALEINNYLGHVPFQKELEKVFFAKKGKDLTPQRKRILNLFTGNIITSNFDTLIESCESQESLSVRVLNRTTHAEINKSIQQDRHSIFKLHGCIEHIDEIVLTKDDYDKAYKPKLKRIFQMLASSHYICFLGCSLEHDEIVQLMGRKELAGFTYYALLELPAYTENKEAPYSPKVASKLGTLHKKFNERKRKLENLGINCIWYPYGQHEAMDAVLAYLYQGSPMKETRKAKSNPKDPDTALANYVKQELEELYSQHRLTPDIIAQLHDKEYCKQQFKLSFPMFIPIHQSGRDKNNYSRYWQTWNLAGTYKVCSQWNEYHRLYFEAWCQALRNK